MQRYIAKLLRQFRFIQIKYRRPDVWTAMADKTESELDTVKQAVYHDVDDNELSMLLRVSQLSGKSLPIGSFTERKISQVVQGTTGVAPIALTLLGPSKVLMEFERSTSVVEVAMILHTLSDWDDLKIQTHCVMARRELLVDMFHEKEESEKEKQLLRKEKIKYQSQLGQVVERIGSQIEQLDRKIKLDGPVILQGIVTPPMGSPRQEVQQLVMNPPPMMKVSTLLYLSFWKRLIKGLVRNQLLIICNKNSSNSNKKKGKESNISLAAWRGHSRNYKRLSLNVMEENN